MSSPHDGANLGIGTLAAGRPRIAFPPNWPARIGWIVLALYVVYASTILDITWDRFISGLDQGAKFLSRMFPPDFSRDKLALLTIGMTESLQIAIIATAFGVMPERSKKSSSERFSRTFWVEYSAPSQRA